MFAILTEEREIIVVGPDTRIKSEYSASEKAYSVMAGAWLVHRSHGDKDGGARRSADLCVSRIFAALMDGEPGIDLSIADTGRASSDEPGW